MPMRTQPTHWFVLGLCSLVCLASFEAGQAWAGRFQVTPTRLQLSAKSSTNMLEIRNTGTQPLRFHITAFTWQQGKSGNMVLARTKDIVVYPSLLSVAPGASRNLRIGSLVKFRRAEQAYRIFVSELPPFQAQESKRTGIRVLTRMTIPVFLDPSKRVARSGIGAATIRHRRLTVDVENRGSVHFMLKTVKVVGKSLDGKVLLRRELPGWYVLAGGIRSFSVTLAADDCKRIGRFYLSARTSVGPSSKVVPMPADGCER